MSCVMAPEYIPNTLQFIPRNEPRRRGCDGDRGASKRMHGENIWMWSWICYSRCVMIKYVTELNVQPSSCLRFQMLRGQVGVNTCGILK